MIVRNEEHGIGRAIESAKPIVSEVIVVDTGSDDKTVDVARELGAQVYHRTWEGDFSAARNYSISKATGDWILVLDADEAIAPRDLSLIEHLALDESMCFEFVLRHYTDDERFSSFKPVTGEYAEFEHDAKGYFETSVVRFFPNFPGLYYRGHRDELIEHSIRHLGRHRILRSRVHIHHFGAVSAHAARDRAYGRATTSEKVDPAIPEIPIPEDWMRYFNAGVELFQTGRKAKAVEAFHRSLQQNPRYTPSWINMGYALCELERYEEAAEALLTAMELDPESHEAACNLGVVYLRTKDLRNAELAFERAISINPKYVAAHLNLGKVHALTNRFEESELVYRRLLTFVPSSAKAKAELGAVLLLAQRLSDAEPLLLEAVGHDPSMSDCYYHLAQLYRVQSRPSDAEVALERYFDAEKKKGALALR